MLSPPRVQRSPAHVSKLERQALRLRRLVVEMLYHSCSGHAGGSLSAADIIAALYFHVLRIDPKRPDWPERDRFVLSKGHSCPVLYAALAELGFFPLAQLRSLRACHSPLQGHPDMRKTPGVDMTTGSLGQGLSAAVGMALAGRIDRACWRVFVLLSDGELQEGQTWEAAMAASHHHLDNLIAIVDRNGLQVDGPTEQILALEPLGERWRAFGWHVQEIDGHNMEALLEALERAQQVKGQPAVVIAHTIKGKGVSFMENNVEWHGKEMSEEQFQQALRELGAEEER